MNNPAPRMPAQDLEGRIARLENMLDRTLQQMARLEQVSQTLIQAQQTMLGTVTQAAEKTHKLERGTAALRIRRGLEDAAKFYPKTRSVVFVGREYFGDNAKYAFLSFCKIAAAQGIACHFLTDDEKQYKQLKAAGLPCLPWFVPDWTPADIRTLLEAKIAVLCNVFYPADERGYFPYALLRGAKFVQLWHGIPFKQVGMECIYPPAAYSPRIAEVLSACGPFDVFVGGSGATRESWARRFAFEDYAAAGYPRTDVLFREPTAQDMLNADVAAYRAMESATQSGTPVILYAPTFRDHKPGAWLDDSGLARFADHCDAQDYLLYVNLHPFEQGKLENLRHRWPRMKFVAPQTDIYPLLRHVDVMVTDYSSLALDFLLRDRPVIFYRPDHAEYIAASRPMAAGAERYAACGAMAADTEALIAATDTAVAASRNPAADPYLKARQKLCRELYDHCDGKAGERLNQLIMDRL